MSADTHLTETDLHRIKQLADAATNGPWKAFIEGRDHESGSSFIQTSADDIEFTGATQADHDFIASARQDLPRLLEQVHQYRAYVALLSDAVQTFARMARSRRTAQPPTDPELNEIYEGAMLTVLRAMTNLARVSGIDPDLMSIEPDADIEQR